MLLARLSALHALRLALCLSRRPNQDHFRACFEQGRGEARGAPIGAQGAFAEQRATSEAEQRCENSVKTNNIVSITTNIIDTDTLYTNISQNNGKPSLTRSESKLRRHSNGCISELACSAFNAHYQHTPAIITTLSH